MPGVVANPRLSGRIFSLGLFVADLIYTQKRGDDLPEEFLGIKRARGDNAIVLVSAEWISRAKEALRQRGVSIATNFGGLANAMVSILASLTRREKITLISPCGHDPVGLANAANLKKLGVDTGILRKIMRGSAVSASNLIRNLEAASGAKSKADFHKDYALFLGPSEGFAYSRWMPGDIRRGDIVHIGGMDVPCPKGLGLKQKQARYRRDIAEMVKVARLARRGQALVVADFCITDPFFWELVPESFFKDIHVAKPGISQALAIYNSRHKRAPLKLNTAHPAQMARRHLPRLLKIQDFLLRSGFGAVFMTLDAGGAVISAQEGSVFGRTAARYVPAVPARKFVDGTGCGDAFVSGIIYGLLRGWDMYTSACFASTIGSLIAERVGVTLERRYASRGKWLPVVERRLTHWKNQLII